MRNEFRKNTAIALSALTDRYDLLISPNQIIKASVGQIQEQKLSQKFQNGVRLMEVTHNINFKGQFVFDHYNFYQCPEQKYLTLKNLLDKQKVNYQKNYQISKYIHNQIRFCVAIPSHNNARRTRLYLRNLDSIFQQQYKNYHVVYVDDASTDGTAEYVESYMEQNQIPKQMYTIVKNKQSMGGSYNYYNVAHNYCKEGQIMAFFDGDDSLIGRQVFSMLNAVYQKNKAALTFGRFIPFHLTYYYRDWIKPLNIEEIRSGIYRQKYYFETCHLKTMYVDLYRKLSLQDIKYQNGSYISHSTDTAYMIPGVQMVQQRAILTNEILYQYQIGEGVNENLTYQRIGHDQIRLKKPKKNKLQDLSFADNPKTAYYP